jgi:hypothetical protein
VVRAILFAIEGDVRGAMNVVAPGIVTNAAFTAALGDAVHRPAVIPVPRFALRLLYGELADGALLTSIRATPAILQHRGFEVAFPELRTALDHVVRGETE